MKKRKYRTPSIILAQRFANLLDFFLFQDFIPHAVSPFEQVGLHPSCEGRGIMAERRLRGWREENEPWQRKNHQRRRVFNTSETIATGRPANWWDRVRVHLGHQRSTRNALRTPPQSCWPCRSAKRCESQFRQFFFGGAALDGADIHRSRLPVSIRYRFPTSRGRRRPGPAGNIANPELPASGLGNREYSPRRDCWQTAKTWWPTTNRIQTHDQWKKSRVLGLAGSQSCENDCLNLRKEPKFRPFASFQPAQNRPNMWNGRRMAAAESGKTCLLPLPNKSEGDDD